MKKTIGFKNKKYLVETIITSLLILFLVCLCAYKLIQGCSRIINCIIYAGLVLVGLYWLVVEIINAIKYLKTDLVSVEELQESFLDEVKMLEKMLNYNLSEFKDDYKEDFLIEFNDITFIGEIKGVNSNLKNKHLSQLDDHVSDREDYLK